MTRRFYTEPGSLNAETYDARAAEIAATGPIRGDVAFYGELAGRTGGPVLELGVGTGRVAFALAARGHEVVGVDVSPAMLAEAEARRTALPAEVAARVRLHRASMTDFALAERFALAVIPFRAFQHLLEPDDQKAALRRIHDHLRPGGTLVVDLFDPRLEWCHHGPAEPQSAGEPVRHPRTGNRVVAEMLDRENDCVRQVMRSTWRFTEIDAATGAELRREEEELTLRWTYRWEMRWLLELCGFEVLAEHSAFDGAPPAYGEEQIWVARRA